MNFKITFSNAFIIKISSIMMSDVDTLITQDLQQCRARFLKVIRYLAANVQLAVFFKVHRIKIKGSHVFS